MVITAQRKRAAPLVGKNPASKTAFRRSAIEEREYLGQALGQAEVLLEAPETESAELAEAELAETELSKAPTLHATGTLHATDTTAGGTNHVTAADSAIDSTNISQLAELDEDIAIEGVDVQFTAVEKESAANLGDAVRQYLVLIGKYPLLTAEQEILYGRQVEQGQALLEVQQQVQKALGLAEAAPTLEQWATAANLSPAQLEAQMKSYQNAVDTLVIHNLRLVVAVAKKYLNKSKRLDFLDLIQEGTIGLRRGAEKFEISKGYKFSTYAYWWIRQGITRAIAEQDNMIRLPIHISEKYNKLRRSRAVLTGQLGYAPTLGEIAAASGIEEEKAKSIIESVKSNATASLSHRIGKEEDRELGDLIADAHHYTPDSMLDTVAQQDTITDLLNGLKEKEREVIILRYGLDDGTAKSLQEIGKVLNLSRERVRQIERKAMERLRALASSKKISVEVVF